MPQRNHSTEYCQVTKINKVGQSRVGKMDRSGKNVYAGKKSTQLRKDNMMVQVAEKSQETPSIIKHFAELCDPRKGTLRYHNFMDIIVIGICAVICGADDYEAMAEFGRSKVHVSRTTQRDSSPRHLLASL